MKTIERHEDGWKSALENGAVVLLPPAQDIEVKFIVKIDDEIFNIPISGGLPVKIDNESDAKWIQLSCTTNQMELLYKAAVNVMWTVQRSLGNQKIIQDIIDCLTNMRTMIWKK